MSVSTEITRIQTAKNDIITALNNQNAGLDPTTAKIDDIPDVIDDNYFLRLNGDLLYDNGTTRFGQSGWSTCPDWVYRYLTELANTNGKYLPNYMFRWGALTYFKMPSNIWYIGKYSFLSCNKLQVMDYSDVNYVVRFVNNGTDTNSNGELTSVIGTTDWIDTTALRYIVVPDARLSEYQGTNYYKNFRSYLISKSAYDAL